jgi:hypothetical protein
MLESFGQEEKNSHKDLANKLATLIKTGRLQAKLDLVDLVSYVEHVDRSTWRLTSGINRLCMRSSLIPDNPST